MLGAELRKAREAVGLTQEQVAGKAGISREYLSLLENDRYNPTVDVLIKCCAALGIKAWELLRRVETSKK